MATNQIQEIDPHPGVSGWVEGVRAAHTIHVTDPDSVTVDELVDAGLPIVLGVTREDDPGTQAVYASDVLDLLARAGVIVSDLRAEACRDLRRGGWTYQEIADLLSVNRARAYQIVNGR